MVCEFSRAKKQYRASAPGSIMLFGEHAVLYGKSAIACAVNQRITVTLTMREDDHIVLDSSTLGLYETTLNALTVEPPFHFVLAVIQRYREQLIQGIDVKIEADFSHQLGLGSSAAVTVALLAVLRRALSLSTESTVLLTEAKAVIVSLQRQGSGMDALASILGGVVYSNNALSIIEPLSITFPLTLIYSGSKMPTAQVIARVSESYQHYSQLFDTIFNVMDQCTLLAKAALLAMQWGRVGELMNIHQGFQESLGVNNQCLSEIIYQLRSCQSILGAKISGSGLGDCVIGFGNLSESEKNLMTQRHCIPVAISEQGLLWHD